MPSQRGSDWLRDRYILATGSMYTAMVCDDEVGELVPVPAPLGPPPATAEAAPERITPEASTELYCCTCGDHQVAEDGDMCEDCWICVHCNNEMSYESVQLGLQYGGPYCTRCWSRMEICHHCHAQVHYNVEEGRFGTDGHYYCSRCYREVLVYCIHCDSFHRNRTLECSSPLTLDENGRQRPSRVVQCDGRIHSYSHRPEWVAQFHPVKGYDTSELYGVELEVGSLGVNSGSPDIHIASALNDLKLSGFMKHDGSIGGCNGIEIVFHPMSRLYIDNHQEDLAEFLSRLRSKGFDSHNNKLCGLHIHINRASFGQSVRGGAVVGYQSHVYKFTRLFTDNQPSWYAISRRTSGSWERWCGLKGSKKHALNWAKGNINYNTVYDNRGNMVGESAHQGHYHGINLTPSRTIEIRVFRGTLNTLSFFGALEFVRLARDYSLVCGYEDTAFDKMLAFGRERQAKYPMALAYYDRLNPRAASLAGD